MVFMIHWLACGYRIAGQKDAPLDPDGWVVHLARYYNVTAVDEGLLYAAALYWASGTVTLVGFQGSFLAPTCAREWAFSAFANLIAYIFAVYLISWIASIVQSTGEMQREQEILLDNYLEMFDNLRIDPRLKYTVYAY